MHHILSNPRYGCELHGCLKTLEEISGAVPVVHANPGCVYQHYLSDRWNRVAGGGVYGPEIPATEVIEKQIVFGGASRLREEIKHAAKVIGGSLYVILGSCESAMVGDDMAAMTREARDVSLPAVFCRSAGFCGGSHGGYSKILKAIIRQLPEIKKINAEKIGGLINVFGILPKTDIFYKGDLMEIRRLLEAAGLEANLFFGTENGLAGLERSARAEHSLVFSRWGLGPAKELEELYGIPCTVFDSLPLGFNDVKSLFTSLASITPIDKDRSRLFLEKEENQYRYLLRSLADPWYGEGLGKRIVLAGDTAAVHRIGSFLHRELGAALGPVILTDRYGPAEEQPPPPDWPGETVHWSGDSVEIEEIIRGTKAEFVLGSILELPAARDLEIPHLVISAPNGGDLPLHKTYAGIAGAYFLMEDYASAIVRNNGAVRSGKRKRLEELNVFQNEFPRGGTSV
jgi:nitrogenase molybdenum-iron protein beta chain